MTLRFLLDTNVISESFLPSPDRRVMEKLQRLRGHYATAAASWHELLFGAEIMPAGRRRSALERYLADVATDVPILPYDAAAARWHAAERGRLRVLGFMTPFIDGQIAAIAAVNDLVLVTNNVRDFRRWKGLEVERWHSAAAR